MSAHKNMLPGYLEVDEKQLAEKERKKERKWVLTMASYACKSHYVCRMPIFAQA